MKTRARKKIEREDSLSLSLPLSFCRPEVTEFELFDHCFEDCGTGNNQPYVLNLRVNKSKSTLGGVCVSRKSETQIYNADHWTIRKENHLEKINSPPTSFERTTDSYFKHSKYREDELRNSCGMHSTGKYTKIKTYDNP